MKVPTIKILLVTAALALTLTGCGTKNMAPEPVAAPEPAAPPPETVVVVVPPPAFVIEGVNFDFDKSTLKPVAVEILDEVASALREQPGVHYEIAGFTDSIGSDAYNQGLSERRAAAVRDYLVNHGVEAGQLTTRGYGESNPVASNSTKAGRAENRRVEVRPMG